MTPLTGWEGRPRLAGPEEPLGQTLRTSSQRVQPSRLGVRAKRNWESSTALSSWPHVAADLPSPRPQPQPPHQSAFLGPWPSWPAQNPGPIVGTAICKALAVPVPLPEKPFPPAVPTTLGPLGPCPTLPTKTSVSCPWSGRRAVPGAPSASVVLLSSTGANQF